MFDIGFWELTLIAIVALLVVGPKEFPVMVRTLSSWARTIRRFVNDARNEIDREFSKAEELKKLMEKEAKIAESHRNIDTSKPAVNKESNQVGHGKSETLTDKSKTESAD